MNHCIDTVHGFGQEWSTFTQTERDLPDAERERIFDGYFGIFPWDKLPPYAVGADIGCGSGRWAKLAAPKVSGLYCVDPSSNALRVASDNVRYQNVMFFLDTGDLPDSLDFAYSLGVLHHVPDTQAALNEIASKLKQGAPFLVYLYYAFDNRPAWYKALWQASNILRKALARCPFKVKFAISQIVSAIVYWPLARIAQSPNWPLHFYKDKSFYTMRTDAYDRLCTKLEKRFSKGQITDMLLLAGFERIEFSDKPPYWVALAYKA